MSRTADNCLFTYGSLMCQDIMTDVAGPCLRMAEAVLQGYCCLKVKKEHYPGIIRKKGCHVHGLVYEGITAAGFEKLDAFEGEMYERLIERVTLSDGEQKPAFVYVVKEKFIHRLEEEAWDFDAFLRRGKARFKDQYKGFRIIKPDSSI